MAAFGIRRRCCVRGQRQIPGGLSCFHGEKLREDLEASVEAQREGMGAGFARN